MELAYNLKGAARKELGEVLKPGDLVLTVGAGDIYRAGEALLK